MDEPDPRAIRKVLGGGGGDDGNALWWLVLWNALIQPVLDVDGLRRGFGSAGQRLERAVPLIEPGKRVSEALTVGGVVRLELLRALECRRSFAPAFGIRVHPADLGV